MIDTSAIGEVGEDVMHFGAVRIRVNGAGNLLSTFRSLDKVKMQQLPAFVMQANTNIEPLKLANFISQRAFLKVETLNINEIFRINRIIIYVKPMWTQYYGQ